MLRRSGRIAFVTAMLIVVPLAILLDFWMGGLQRGRPSWTHTLPHQAVGAWAILPLCALQCFVLVALLRKPGRSRSIFAIVLGSCGLAIFPIGQLIPIGHLGEFGLRLVYGLHPLTTQAAGLLFIAGFLRLWMLRVENHSG
jgi:hypothetical protein